MLLFYKENIAEGVEKQTSANIVLYCTVRQLPYILVMGVVPSLMGNVCVYVCMYVVDSPKR